MPLAPYHLSVKTVSRGKGRSATAACAYRSGERIEDARTGKVFDYSRRGGVERAQCEIFAPEGSPAWAWDRQALWNAAEASEKRVNSVVAREFEIGLPADLDDAERRALVRGFAGALVERHGVVVDASIHGPDEEAREGRGNRNHHAHILCSTRRLGTEGFGEKTRELDDQRSGTVLEWRADYAAMCGDALERAGFDVAAARWRSGHLDKAGQLEAARGRGDEAFVIENEERVPGKHFGPNIIQIEAKGIVTERGDKARVPERKNAQVIDLAEARKRIAAELAQAGREQVEPEVGREQVGPEPESERERVGQEPTRPEPARPGPVKWGLFDAARASRYRTGLLDEVLPAAASPRPAAISPAAIRPAAIVLREWRAKTDRQFAGVARKAERVADHAGQLLARHERRQEQHRQRRPAEPTGLFAAVSRRTHEIAARAWEQTRAAIQKRIDRLHQHLDKLAGYMRRAFPHEPGASPGERLAEKKAEAVNPALASEARVAINGQWREQQGARRPARAGGGNAPPSAAPPLSAGAGMAKEGTVDALATTGGAQRRAAEERARLERDGKLAAKLSDSIEAPSAAPRADGREIADRMAGKEPGAAIEGKPAQTEQEKRVAEARERIKASREKEREDREQDNGRGRGR